MVTLGARRVTALQPVGTVVLLALPAGTTVKYELAGEMSSFDILLSARHVLADGRPVVHDGRFYVGDFKPVED